MKRFPKIPVTALFACTLILIAELACARNAELGVNIYGLSYHFPGSGYPTDRLNEVNPGLGIRASFQNNSRGYPFVEGGFFKDSMRNRAKYFSVGYLYKVVHEFRVGLNVGIYSSKTIRRGDPVFAPIPMLSYTIGPASFNAAYLPKVDDLNFHVVGFYLTLRALKH